MTPSRSTRGEGTTLKPLPLVAIIGILAAGCVSWGPPAVGAVTPEVERATADILASLVPTSCKMLHKVHLRARSRDALLTGHLVLDRRHGLRGVALDEIGGPVFAFATCPGHLAVDRTLPGIRDEHLAIGPVRDLELTFRFTDSPPVAAGIVGELVEVQWREGERLITRSFDLEAKQLLGCREWKGRRLLREIRYRYGPNPGDVIPTGVIIHNRAMRYRMDLEMLEVTAAPEYDHSQWCGTLTSSQPE